MHERTCASCGARVGVLLDQCPACGRDPDVQLLELGVGTGRRRRDTTAPLSSPRVGQPKHRRRGVGWRQWAPVAAAVLAVWGFLVVSSGDDGDDEGTTQQADEESTSTSRKRTERTPGTRRGPRIPTTTTLQIEGAPFLGEPTGLVAVVVGERPTIVDLDAGTLRELPRDISVMAASDDRLLVQGADGLEWWPAPFDGTGSEPLVAPNAEQVWVDPDGAAVWYTTSRSTGEQQVMLLDAEGGVALERVLAFGSWPVGASTRGLVVNAPGGVFIMDVDGTASRISTGSALSTAGDTVIVNRCDESMRCITEVVSLDGEVLEEREAGSNGLTTGPWGFGGWVSPEGRTAQLVDVDGRPALAIDGEVLDGMPRGIALTTLAWSPDGRWLFAGNDAGSIYVVDGSTGTLAATIASQRRGYPAWQMFVVDSTPSAG